MQTGIRTLGHRTWWALLLLGVVSGLMTGCDGAVASADQAKETYDQAADGDRRAKNAGDPLIGRPGPDVAVTTLEGKRIDLAALYGEKPVYLKFWATWCVPCRKQMPGFQKMYETYGDRIQVVAVNTGFSDTAKAARAYRDRLDLSMSIAVDDGTLGKALNLRVTPQHVLIDRSGRIAYVGHRDDAELHKALQAVLADKTATGVSVQGADVADTDARQLGDSAEGLRIDTLDGREIDLSADHGGKPRALVFFAPWCESYLAESRPQTAHACRRVRETVDELAKRNDAVRWLGISSGLWASTSDLEDYRASTGITIPLALDASGDLYRAFGIREIPSVVFIGRDGTVVRKLGPQDHELARATDSVAGQ